MLLLKDELLLRALQGRNTERPPIWLMRQAGRYMPDYQKLRSQWKLIELFRRPELAAKVTLMPIEQLGVDAAILFSDILVILDALEVPFDFVEGKGPVVEPLREKKWEKRKSVREALWYIPEIIERVLPQLEVPLIGFCGGPFTVASYWMKAYGDPESFEKILDLLTEVTKEYLLLQIESGVSVVQIFDSWAGKLSLPDFRRFVLPRLAQLGEVAKSKNIPAIFFCRAPFSHMQELAEVLRPAAISVDWQTDLTAMRQAIPSEVALQGNLDPTILLASKEVIQRETDKLLESRKGDPAYIFNLGHGVLPKTPLENVQWLVECVKNASY